MYPLHLSYRFVSRHLLMTLIGSFFVGASLAILIVVMAVMDGFQIRLKQTFAGASADLVVTPRYEADLDKLEAALKRRLGDRVVAAAPHYRTVTTVRREGEIDPAVMDEFEVVQVFGVDGLREQRVNQFREYLTGLPSREIPLVRNLDDPFAVSGEDAAYERSGVILGTRLAKHLFVRPDDRVNLFALVRRGGGDGGGRNTQLKDFELRQELFVVLGEYESGNGEIDGACLFLDRKDFMRFFDPRMAKASVRIRLARGDADYGDAVEILRADWYGILRESLPDGAAPPAWLREDSSTASSALLCAPWYADHTAMIRAIESEKAMILVITFLILVAGASSIFAAQWLLVTDKVREIGILRALGAGVRGITSIFVLNGCLMGVVGSVGGTLAGLLFVHYIDGVHEGIRRVTGREVFDHNIYLFDRIPTHVDPQQVVQFALAALVCTLIAATVPALRAGFMDPARALHHE